MLSAFRCCATHKTNQPCLCEFLFLYVFEKNTVMQAKSGYYIIFIIKHRKKRKRERGREEREREREREREDEKEKERE